MHHNDDASIAMHLLTLFVRVFVFVFIVLNNKFSKADFIPNSPRLAVVWKSSLSIDHVDQSISMAFM